MTAFPWTTIADYAANPDNCFAYWGTDDEDPHEWAFAPIAGTHRDCSILDTSNAAVIRADLLTRFPDHFRVESASHWAVGWYEHFLIRVPRQETPSDDDIDWQAVNALREWVRKLDSYPVADEDDLTERESEEEWTWWSGYGGREWLENELKDLYPDDDQEDARDAVTAWLDEVDKDRSFLLSALHDQSMVEHGSDGASFMASDSLPCTVRIFRTVARTTETPEPAWLVELTAEALDQVMKLQSRDNLAPAWHVQRTIDELTRPSTPHPTEGNPS